MSTTRESLARRQDALLEGLLQSGTVAGFDPQRTQMVRRALARKRCRESLASWPGLADRLPDPEGRFLEWARQHPRQRGAGPLEDGFAFCHWLARQGHPLALEIVARHRLLRGRLKSLPPWAVPVRRLWIRLFGP